MRSSSDPTRTPLEEDDGHDDATSLLSLLRSETITLPSCLLEPLSSTKANRRGGGGSPPSNEANLAASHSAGGNVGNCISGDPLVPNDSGDDARQTFSKKRERARDGDEQHPYSQTGAHQLPTTHRLKPPASVGVVAVAVLPSIKALTASATAIAKHSSVISLQFIVEEWGTSGEGTGPSDPAHDHHRRRHRRANGSVVLFPAPLEPSPAPVPHSDRNCPLNVDDNDAVIDVDDGDNVNGGVGCSEPGHNDDDGHPPQPFFLSGALVAPPVPTLVRTARIVLAAPATTSTRQGPLSAEFTCAASFEGMPHPSNSLLREVTSTGGPVSVRDAVNIAPWINSEWAPGLESRPMAGAGHPTHRCGCGVLSFRGDLHMPRRVMLCEEHLLDSWRQCFSPAMPPAPVCANDERGPPLHQRRQHNARAGGCPAVRHVPLAEELIRKEAGVTTPCAQCVHQFGLCVVHDDVPGAVWADGCSIARRLDPWHRADQHRRVVEVFVSSALVVETLSRLATVDQPFGTAEGVARPMPVRCYVTNTSLVLDIPPQARNVAAGTRAHHAVGLTTTPEPMATNGHVRPCPSPPTDVFGFLRQAEFRIPRLHLPAEGAYRQTMLAAVGFHSMESSPFSDGMPFNAAEADGGVSIVREAVVPLPLMRAFQRGARACRGLLLGSRLRHEISPRTFRVGLADMVALLSAVDAASDANELAASSPLLMSFCIAQNGVFSLRCDVVGAVSHTTRIIDWGVMVLSRHHGDSLLFTEFEEDELRHPEKHPVDIVGSLWASPCDVVSRQLRDFLLPFTALNTTTGASPSKVELFFTTVASRSEVLWTIRVPSVGLCATTAFFAEFYDDDDEGD